MDGGVSTSMDQLVELLEKRDTIKVTDAARELGTDKEHIESWTRMLEKAGLVQLHYSVIGGAFVKRGPKFDTLAAGRALQAPGLRAEPKPAPAAAVSAGQAAKPAAQATPAAAGVGSVSAETTAPRGATTKLPSTVDTSMKYLLIRKRIEDEEVIVQENMKKLHGEEQKVMEYMNMLIGEGKKLTEYIETLRQILEGMNKGKQGAASVSLGRDAKSGKSVKAKKKSDNKSKSG